MRFLLTAFAVLLLLAPARALSAQASTPPSATATRASTPPRIDGRLDDATWAGVRPLSGLVQREPVEGAPVSERTEVRILYDDDALYVGAWLYDDRPSDLVFGQTLRDASLNDADAFVIVFDTYRDRQNGFVFGTTPAGIEYDGQFTDEGGSAGFGGGGGGSGGGGGGGGIGRQQSGSGGGFNLNWDGSWEVATSTDGEGWYAEMRIPFSTLRYGTGGPQTWGLNFERSIRRNNEQSVWSPLPRQFTVYRVSLAGALQLEAPASRIMTVSPFVLADAFKDYTVAGPETDFGAKVGGDAKIGLSQSLTLDLTVNTDFAQAEVDDQQINLTRFSLFYPEKRAFFLENAGTFSVGAGRSAELFFSRQIGLAAGREVPIHAGTRVTGKVGGLQVGLLDIQTGDLVEKDTAGVATQIAPNNNFGVLRAFREFANRTRIGGIFVSRINTDDTQDYNLTYGVDGQLGVGQDLTFDGWASVTTTPVPDDTLDTRSGFNNGEYGFALGGDYLTREWEASLGYRQIGNEFNPEVGFVNRLAYRRANARLMYHWRIPSVSWLRELRPHSSYEQYWSLGGFSESYLVHMDNHFVFENGALIQLPTVNLTGEGLEKDFTIHPGITIPAGTYNNVEWDFRANTNRSAPLSVSAGWTLGGFYSGTQFSPNAQLSYRYRDRFTASLRANYYDVHLDEGDFTTSVVGLTGSYSFTPRLYLTANVQYNNDTRDFATNLRLGWLDTAGTGLFIVYNDTEHTGSLVDTGYMGGAKQRQITVKFSRLFDIAR